MTQEWTQSKWPLIPSQTFPGPHTNVAQYDHNFNINSSDTNLSAQNDAALAALTLSLDHLRSVLSGYWHVLVSSEWLHPSAHRCQAEPDRGGELSASTRSHTQCRVPAGHYTPASCLAGGPAWYCGSAYFQTGQRQCGEQGVTSDWSGSFLNLCIKLLNSLHLFAFQSGLTPLHLVAQEGHVGIADMLVKQRASIYAATRVNFISVIDVRLKIFRIWILSTINYSGKKT